MPGNLLDLLDLWKSRYGQSGHGRLERLLAAAAKRRFRDAASLIRLHETLLFLRAYPSSPEVARRADEILFAFAKRIAALRTAGVDLSQFEEPEVSGIAGTSLSAVFSFDVARRLAARHPRYLEIAWDRYDEIDRFGATGSRCVPLLAEDWPVEAHVPYREWVAAGLRSGGNSLAWLLERLNQLPLAPRDRADRYDALAMPLTWEIKNARTSRSHLRLPGRKPFCHREPLIRRSAVSLAQELEGSKIPVRRLPRQEARTILGLILDTSAMRYRELYGFSHPDEAGVFHADVGRGVEVFFFGVPPEWRLPLRAYHAGMFFKNGVPAGYVELLSLFEWAETGFNLYYTFREGESAWLYARLLHLFHQVLGVNTFSVDPYQIGLENQEAIDSGAFWFYRKLGFRPVDPKVAGLVAREERKLCETPGHRSSERTLEKLAAGYILFEGPGAEVGAWDRFRVRNLGLAVQRRTARYFDGNPEAIERAARVCSERHLGIASSGGLSLFLSVVPDLKRWTKEEKLAARMILQAKESGEESRYLRLMQRHPRLRAAFLALGSSAG
jgi:hypothetical protein